MFDYLFCTPDDDTAIADAALGAFYHPPAGALPGDWHRDFVIPGAQVWLDSGDTTSTITDPMMGTQTVTTHTYLPGWWLIISQASRNAALEASPYLIFGTDRDKSSPTNTEIVALGPGQSAANFVGAHVSPTFDGSSYPA